MDTDDPTRSEGPATAEDPAGPGSSTPSPLEVAVARDQIRDLVSRYAVAVDSRNLEALVGLFVDDVRVGRSAVGREALLGSFRSSLSAVGVTILQVGTHVIDVVDEDHADGLVYCSGQVQEGDDWIHQAILYRDTYERRDGRWYFVRRIHELFHGVAATTNPLDQPPADWPERSTGRGTVPESFPTWSDFWQA